MRAIIVEDEVLARQELTYLIQTHSRIKIAAEFEDGLEALKYLQTDTVDVIFLDINIPSIDGVLLAHNISRFAVKPYIVFITAYKEHAAEAFEIEAFDYILKPYSETRIRAMLQKLEGAIAARSRQGEEGPVKLGSDKVNLWKNEKIIVVDADEIYYASAQEKTTSVITKGRNTAWPSVSVNSIPACRRSSSSAVTAPIWSICPKSRKSSPGSTIPIC